MHAKARRNIFNSIPTGSCEIFPYFHPKNQSLQRNETAFPLFVHAAGLGNALYNWMILSFCRETRSRHKIIICQPMRTICEGKFWVLLVKVAPFSTLWGPVNLWIAYEVTSRQWVVLKIMIIIFLMNAEWLYFLIYAK